MSTNTPNYNLEKPDANEFYDVNVQNDNLDAIDQALKDNSDAAAANTQSASDNEDSINALAQTAAANAQAISDNAEAISDTAQTVSLHEQNAAQMASGIDLSAGDVTLASGDYYKGLLVVAAAHDTHALILPNVNNHKYDIYNADPEHTLLVKKAGGTAVEVPPEKLCRVAYDGTEYRAISGSGAIVYKNPTPIKAGDDAAGNLLSWIEENSQWEKREFGMPYDGSDIVSSGKFTSEGIFSAGEIGYKLYRQEDGAISTSARPESYYLGWIESTDTAWIGMLGGIDKEYTDDMDSFFAVPGISGKIRLKIKMPATAEGVMIRRSTSAYDGSGIAWGDLVTNITDDALYSGDNEWYKDDDGGIGLSNGTQYFYKAFPYLGSAYNVIGGNNESSCKAGGGEHEYSGDNVSGSTLIDTFDSQNGAATDITYPSGKVGNCMDPNNSGSPSIAVDIFSPTEINQDWTMSFWLKCNDATSDGSFDEVLSMAGGGRFSAYQYNSQIAFEGRDTSSTGVSVFCTAPTTWAHIVYVRDKANGISLYVNNILVDSDPSTVDFYDIFGSDSLLGDADFNGLIDQIRWYSRVLEAYEIANLYNGGDGC